MSTLPEPTDTASVAKALVVVTGSLLLGALTSWAQGVLPDAFASFANSASGWTILTALLVASVRLRPSHSAIAAAVSFVLLVIGYTLASELRGLHYDPTRWAAIGVVAGPFIGTAVAWLRTSGLRAAMGTAVLAAVGIGEAIHGLTVIRETTSPVYWSLVGALGVLLLLVMLVRTIRGAVPVAAALGLTALGSAVLLVGYKVIG